MITSESNINNYFTSLYNYREKYLIIITVQDEAQGQLSNDTKNIIATLNLPLIFNITYRDSYMAIIDRGNVIFEDVGAKQITYTYNTDNKTFSILSGGYNVGNTCYVNIDNTQYAAKGRGFNIVVYDYLSHLVVSSVSFDTCGNSNPGINRKAVNEVSYQIL